MRVLKVLVLPAVLFLLVTAESSPAATPPPSPSPTTPPSPSPPPPSPSPSPSPIPVNAFLSLDLGAGGPNTVITITGGQFNPNEPMAIYWDVPQKVIGNATADGNGSFSNVKVKPFAGEKPGLHQICASVAPNPCAQFELQGSPTPTPSAPPSPSESPSPTESPSATPSESPTPSIVPVPAGNDTNNLQVLLQPPFIFLPFIAALGLLGAIAYWAFGATAARRRLQPLPSATIVHHSVRPEGMPGVEYAPPPSSETEPAPAEDRPFTPEELHAPWPSLERPPLGEPDQPEPPELPRD